MMNSTAGSTWRKWDLHVHVPGAHLNDGYVLAAGGDVVDEFCQRIESSDVDGFGLTDYFDSRQVHRVIARHKELYPHSEKFLIANVELRLNENVSKAAEYVHAHLLFNSGVSTEEVDRFVGRLGVDFRDGRGRKARCEDLTTKKDYESALVTIDAINRAIREELGDAAQVRRDDYLLALVPCVNNGIRATGEKRKQVRHEEIDRWVDGVFGGSGNRAYFLREDRYEHAGFGSSPKPVIAASDAHSFDEFDAWVGKDCTGDHRKETCWIKADLSWSGLLQILLEPEDRVFVGEVRPDLKEPHKYLDRVTFDQADTFPQAIRLNPNLNAIIGSRSSGKSALLAHVAYAISPEETLRKQLSVEGAPSESELGPAPGVTWTKGESAQCRVHWASAEASTGNVIYVPQNSLYSLSRRPKEITEKIRPVIRARFPELDHSLDNLERALAEADREVRESIEEWFSTHETAAQLRSAVTALGDPAAIQARLSDLATAEPDVEEGMAAQLERFITSEGGCLADQEAAEAELSAIEDLFATPDDPDQVWMPSVQASIRIEPDARRLPQGIQSEVLRLVNTARANLEESIVTAITSAHLEAVSRCATAASALGDLRDANEAVVHFREQSEQRKWRAAQRLKYEQELRTIRDSEERLEESEGARLAAEDRLTRALETRMQAYTAASQVFDVAAPSLEGLRFFMEIGLDDERRRRVSQAFNKQKESPFVQRGDWVRIEEARANPGEFLALVLRGDLRLNSGSEPMGAVSAVFLAREEVRLAAELDGDRIGGFGASSMTPGKQALFALTLLLSEDQSGWPLLLDQPEDDLDSRSIYDVLVPYLRSRKKERQIVLVSHNANLVVGADSENVIVANRHGIDRPNRDGRTFDYVTGALEMSVPKRDVPETLLQQGIREHACELLDGGEAAFAERSAKYRL